ncbi:ankyrin repeat-containing domain protein [Gorgonomyces haynaldii]|nr:ankyrin repeat-containing domain protein [Gorgonomyces haynaldii]
MALTKYRDSIMYAARGGYLDLVTMLLPDAKDSSWLVFACCAAILNGYDHIVDYIMHQLAAKARVLRLCEFLIPLGYSVNEYYFGADPFKKGFHDTSILHFAAAKAKIQICAWALDLGLDINSRNEKGRSPLFYAVTTGNLDLCRFLVSKGVEIHVTDEAGETLMGIAAACEFSETIRFLVESGIQVDRMRSQSYVKRERLLGQRDHGIKHPVPQYETIKTLLALGAQHQKYIVFGILDMYVGIQPDEQTALELADPRGYLRKQPSWRQQTLLQYCVFYQMTVYCQLFLEHGAEPNHENQYGQTALYENARQGDPQICRLLLKHGAKVNHQDVDGNTPPHFAMKERRLKVCRLLLQSGALHVKNNDGKLPADLFVQAKHPKMLRKLSLEQWMQTLI